MKLLDRPKLKDPILVAGWPGMGLVAFKAVAYLLENLTIKELAHFDMPDLYQVRGVSVANGIVEEIELPRGRAFYHLANGRGRDLILFLGEEQPVAGKEVMVSREILEMARAFDTREVFTFAAMVTGTSHHATPKVWGCTTKPAVLERMKSYDILPMSEGQISGLNGLLVGVARMCGMEASCLLGELPYYATQIAYYPAACAVLEKFVALAGVSIALEAMRQQSKTTQIEIDTYIEQIKREALRKKEESFTDESLDPSQKEDDESILN